MNKSINIDGVEYVEKAQKYQDSDHICVIADRGWIFEGYKVDCEGENIKLMGASVVRSWTNGLGIGGIANPEHKDDYTLDYIGNIEIYSHAILATISLAW